jgi:metal-dependent hydrolase (beta-lactamase superfamily II)
LSLLLHHYKGTQIADICDDAIVFAHKNHYDHVVGFLREYKEQRRRSPVMESQEPVELDDWIH